MIRDPWHYVRATGFSPPRGPVELDRTHWSARGLVACWPLFVGNDRGLKDLSPSRAHLVKGATTAAPTWLSRVGFDSRVLDFDGSNDEAHVEAGDVAPLKITGNAITLSAWVYQDADASANGDRIISKRTSAGGSDVYAMFPLGVGGGQHNFYFRLAGPGDLVWTGLSTLVTNQWLLWTGVYDGANAYLYRNGGLIDSDAKSGNITDSTQEVYLGHRKNETRHFPGSMADVRVWNRALSAGEVRALYDPATRWEAYVPVQTPKSFWAVLTSLGDTVAVTKGAITATGQIVVGSAAELYQTLKGAITVAGQNVVGAAATLETVVKGTIETAGQVVVGSAATVEVVVRGALTVAGQTVVGLAGNTISILVGAVQIAGQTVQGAAATVEVVTKGAVQTAGQLVTTLSGNFVAVATGAISVIRKTVTFTGSGTRLVLSSLIAPLVRTLKGDDV